MEYPNLLLQILSPEEILTVFCQILIPLGILNVWLFRSEKSTGYRGRGADNLKDEFRAYGLPAWMFHLVGTLKVAAAIAILVGIWAPLAGAIGAVVMAILMVGALAMHLKVRDPVKKLLPAISMLLMSLWLVVTSL